MTAPTGGMTPHDIACKVQEATELAMGPGGSLYVKLSDLLTEAEGVAIDAAGAKRDRYGVVQGFETWGLDHDRLVDLVRWEIAEHLFRVALENAKAEPITA